MILTVGFAPNCCTRRVRNAGGLISASDRGQPRDWPRRADHTGDNRGPDSRQTHRRNDPESLLKREAEAPATDGRLLSSRIRSALGRFRFRLAAAGSGSLRRDRLVGDQAAAGDLPRSTMILGRGDTSRCPRRAGDVGRARPIALAVGVRQDCRLVDRDRCGLDRSGGLR